MNFSDNAMSAILLCSYVGIRRDDLAKPFSQGEWNIFLDRMKEQKQEPGAVLAQDFSLWKDMKYSEVEISRIHKLLHRGGNVAFELDDFARKGIEVITQFDADYPVLLKRKLKKKTPPVMYYAGNIDLAKKIGIAVVGSRNVDEEGIAFTRKLVEKAAQERLIIYSGGAKGVDSISENAAINAGSAVVSFVAESLIDKIKKKDILNNVMQGKMLLLSDVKPDVGFSAARAMNRNKYIYASSYGAFVISSDYKKGGTWAGATETLKHEWTKVLVWNYKEYEGNMKLIERGAIPYELSEERLYDVITKKEVYSQLYLWEQVEVSLVSDNKAEYKAVQDKSEEENTDVYEVIKNYFLKYLGDGMNAEEASKKFNVAKGQMQTWLKRLYSEGAVTCENGVYTSSDKSQGDREWQ